MPHISLEFLPLDVHDDILTYLPDQVSLRCAVLASRKLHEAYTLRTQHILSMVVANEVGPALPFALELVRARNSAITASYAMIVDGLNNSDLKSVSYWKGNISSKEARDITRMSGVARRLEALFSNRYVV